MTVSHIIVILSECDQEFIIKRWDNAPHWNKVSTYPFHAHVVDQKEPVESKEMFVSDVIAEIRKISGF